MQNNRCGGGISEGAHGTGIELSLPRFKLQVEQKYGKEVRTDLKICLGLKKNGHIGK